jgi:orotate phosphoribosyltransferase
MAPACQPARNVTGVDDRAHLLELIKAKAIVWGRVTLASGREADYYVDLRRITLDAEAAPLVGTVMLELTADLDYDAVGGLTMGADPVACAALAGGFRGKAFFVRKEVKAHGLARRIEGPLLAPGDRCAVVEDVVSTGGSTLTAIAALREAGLEICGVISVLDRLMGGREAIEAAARAPYVALTTIDDVYPGRPPA